MKKRIKDITIGILIGCMLMTTTPVLADDIVQQINVIFDGVEVQINGEKLDSPTILYNGTTYLPMRKVAEAVGKEIDWNPDAKIANIVEKVNLKNEETENISNVGKEEKEDSNIMSYEDFSEMFSYTITKTTEHNEILTTAKYNGDLSKSEFIELWYSIDNNLKDGYSKRFGKENQLENKNYTIAIYYKYGNTELGYMFAYPNDNQLCSFVENPFKIDVEVNNPF